MANRYWVGGSGNWTDTAHWSATPGGPGGASIPDAPDDVFFDANSFNAPGQIVTSPTTQINCRTMDWQGVTNNPTFNLNSDLQIWGSLFRLSSNMIFSSSSVWNNIYFSAPSTLSITTGGNILPYLLVLSGTATTISMQDSLTMFTLDLSNRSGATFNTNNYVVTVLGKGKIDIGPAIFNAGTSTIIFQAGTDPERTSMVYSVSSTNVRISSANIVLDSYTGIFVGNAPIGRVTFKDWGTIDNIVRSNGGTHGIEILHGTNIFIHGFFISLGNVNLIPGVIIYFWGDTVTGGTVTLTGDFNVSGEKGKLTLLRSVYTGGITHTLIKNSGTVNLDYVDIQDSRVQGGATWYAGVNSVNRSNNAGWLFSSPDSDIATVDLQVSSSTDDANNINSNGTFSATAVAQYIGNNAGTDYWNGWRWLNVNIPRGAVIARATLDLYSAGAGTGTSAPCIFYGERSTNAAVFSNNTAGKPQGRTRTTALVTKVFNPANWVSTGFGIDLVDVTSLIQEIVNQSGWAKGNALVLVGHDNGSANNNYIRHSTFDDAPARGAKLTITYVVSATPTNLFFF